MSMNEVIRCTLVGVGSVAHGELQTNPTGRQTWVGVRVRTADGKSRFLPGLVVEAEAAIILLDAMDRGETVELWLTGKAERAYPYGIRTKTEDWYSNAFSRYLNRQGVTVLIFALVTLPLIGLGLLFLPIAIWYFVTASTFSARRSRAMFDRGHEGGVLGTNAASASGERLQVA